MELQCMYLTDVLRRNQKHFTYKAVVSIMVGENRLEKPMTIRRLLRGLARYGRQGSQRKVGLMYPQSGTRIFPH